MASSSTTSKKVVGIVVAVVLFVSFALLAMGEWAPSIGIVGLLRNLCTAAGFVLFALSLAAFVVLLVVNARASFAGKVEGFVSVAPKLLRETVRFLVASVVYVGSGIVALAVLASFADEVPSPARLLAAFSAWSACLGVVVLYRFYRKRHPVQYEFLSWVGVLLVLCFVMFAGFSMGAIASKDSIVDLIHGPKTELCWLAEVDEERATGRYSGFRQDSLHLTFKTTDDRDVHINVAESDRPGLSDVVNAEGVVWLTYYPESGVYVAAEPGMDDYLALGE